MVLFIFLINLVFCSERTEMRDAGLKVAEILLKDSEIADNTEKKIKLYYKNNIPDEIKDVLTVVLPFVRITRDKKITIIDWEF